MDSPSILGAIVAIVSGLTVLAYKNPIGFKRLYFPIATILLLTSVGLGAWNAGVTTAAKTLLEFVPAANIQQATASSSALLTPIWHFLVLVVMFVYLVFLLWLPYILNEEKETKPKRESDS